MELVLDHVHFFLQALKNRPLHIHRRWISILGHGQSPMALFSMFVYILQGTKLSPHI